MRDTVPGESVEAIRPESHETQADSTETTPSQTRGQSAIIGVALLLALTIVSVGVLTAGTGILVDEAAQGADAQRLADRLITAYNPTTLEGTTTLSLSLTGGQIKTAPRRITIRRFGDIVATFETQSLRFQRGDHYVSVLGQAVVRGQAGRARFVRDPGMVSVFGTGEDRTLSLSIVTLAGPLDQTVMEGESLQLAFQASHERRDPGAGRYTISIETATPDPWVEYFEDSAVSVRVIGEPESQTQVVIAELGRVSRARLIVHHVELRSDG